MPYPKIEVEGAVVAVTGGARGIGKATSDLFAAEGATVCIGDLDGADGPNGYVLDVTSRDSFAEFTGAVLDRFGRIDILVSNAGVMPLGDFLSEDDAISRTTLDVNVWGLVHGMRLVLPHMIERGSGHGMPTVEPEDVARAIVGSVDNRRAEITVPRYLAGWDLLNAAVPECVMRLGRKMIGDRRALTSVEHDMRDAYEESIRGQAREAKL